MICCFSHADISLDIPERKRGDKAAPACALTGEIM